MNELCLIRSLYIPMHKSTVYIYLGKIRFIEESHKLLEYSRRFSMLREYIREYRGAISSRKYLGSGESHLGSDININLCWVSSVYIFV